MVSVVRRRPSPSRRRGRGRRPRGGDPSRKGAWRRRPGRAAGCEPCQVIVGADRLRRRGGQAAPLLGRCVGGGCGTGAAAAVQRAAPPAGRTGRRSAPAGRRCRPVRSAAAAGTKWFRARPARGAGAGAAAAGATTTAWQCGQRTCWPRYSALTAMRLLQLPHWKFTVCMSARRSEGSLSRSQSRGRDGRRSERFPIRRLPPAAASPPPTPPERRAARDPAGAGRRRAAGTRIRRRSSSTFVSSAAPAHRRRLADHHAGHRQAAAPGRLPGSATYG